MSNQQTVLAGQVTVGLVQVADRTVLAEYSPTERWNGFLCPRLDALAAVTVLDRLAVLQPGTLAWTFAPDATLIVINLDYVAAGDDLEGCVDVYPTDSDGLYALGAWGWTWQEADGTDPTLVEESGTDPTLAEESGTDQVLARYRAWTIQREVLSAAEGEACGSVSASDWQSSDDEGVELAHRLADLLAR